MFSWFIVKVMFCIITHCRAGFWTLHEKFYFFDVFGEQNSVRHSVMCDFLEDVFMQVPFFL